MVNKYEQYAQSQATLLIINFHKLKRNNGFKSLTQYKQHCRLLKRFSFMFGSRQMDDSLGKNFDKNRLKQMKRKFK